MFDITIENMNTNMVGRKLKREPGDGLQDNIVTELHSLHDFARSRTLMHRYLTGDSKISSKALE